jgi:hypothetical protein
VITIRIVIASSQQENNNKMAANIAFRAFLTRIGINDLSQDAIADQGLSDMQTLSELTQETDIRYLCNNTMKYQAPLVAPGMIQLPFRAVKRLEAARYWIDTRRWLGQTWLATGLTDPELTRAMTRIQQKEERIAASKDVDVTKPEKLTNLKNWQAFWEKWDNYMGQVYGAADIPLQYVYRGHDVVTVEMRNRP